nr:BSR [Brachypodium sp.]
MAGLIVSASTGVLKPLLVKLATLMAEEFAKLKNLRKEVKFISEELTSMKDALERLSDLDELDKQTKGWRDQVREMSYDIEDIIDDFMHHIEEKSETDGLGRKTARLLRKLRSCHQIASQIKEIKALVLETSARRQRYKLDIPPSSDVAMDPRVKALYEKAANLVGMEGPKNEIVDWLIDEEKQLKVVSIVGFGGLGKTTLANAVYATLQGKYDCCAFVPVSQKPNIPNLLRTLLSQLGGTPFPHDCELNILLDDLREHLQNKRYLIIIDDIWTVSAWEIIKCAFPESDLGSRVIVTTRIQEVAAACRSDRRRDYILQMKPLSNEDSTKLFFDRIFGSEQACPQQLRDVSIEILKKCGGLPLAIISISSMLASEVSNQEDRWKHVHDSLGSGTNLTLEGVRKILNLSYKDLPPHLKTCLLYLGMYPEDYTIERTDLERQWMAEGFIGKENGKGCGEDRKKLFQ